jgi:hypothetical protein
MAYINVSAPTSNAIVQITTATNAAAVTTTTGYTIGALQDVTINNAAGVFNWTQLDVFSQLAVSTPATNSISANLVLDSATFFGTNDIVVGTGVPSLFSLSNDATEVQFRVYFNGKTTGSKFVEGRGFITNLAPTVNPTAPVWVSPITISVNGDLSAGTV